MRKKSAVAAVAAAAVKVALATVQSYGMEKGKKNWIKRYDKALP